MTRKKNQRKNEENEKTWMKKHEEILMKNIDEKHEEK